MDDAARETIKRLFMEHIMGMRRMLSSFSHWNDLHIGEQIALRHIAEHNMLDTGYISDLQPNLNVSKPAVSQMMSTLEKKGYVEREINPADRRRVAFKLTPKGLEAYNALRVNNDMFIDRVIDRYGEEESQQLIASLSRLANVMEGIKTELRENE